MLGGFLANGLGYSYAIRHYLGRQRALLLNFSLVSLLFFVAIPHVQLSRAWTLRNIACLLTVPFLMTCWSTSNLLAAELSPTSHRGMVMALTSAAARLGAIAGPYLTLLYNVMDQRIVLGVFGGAATIKVPQFDL